MKITGMGLVCSLGGDVTDVFKRMCAGECGFRPITRFEAEPYAQKKGHSQSASLLAHKPQPLSTVSQQDFNVLLR